MTELILKNAPAEIKSGGSLVSSGTQLRGTKPQKITEMKIILDVDVSEHLKGLDFLFPNCEMHCKEVASIEHYKGEDRTARASVPELNVRIEYDGKILIDQKNCPVKGKPMLKINKNGDAAFILRPLLKLTPAELGLIGEHIESDVRVSVEPSQVDIEHTGDETVVMMRRAVK